eukprot:gnl/TRDRNA2_/TRDRNA2_43290_c0_seq1.p1 gnl/TRDRNA2_/TRDRNA2_43290_c0~~gnl/TRDRNA2_/TRDRNA2_43290_c0_seq1.p1  ORF type:complete len:282 (-),score=67.44 gnl/TRDRNA2_/TRDRNA2_43290_c0_seq1:83-928(-)
MAVFVGEDGDAYRAELRRLATEEKRLREEARRLRGELRHVRPAAAIASTLHKELFGTSEGASPSPRAAATATSAEAGSDEQELARLRDRLASATSAVEKAAVEANEVEERLRQQRELECEARRLIEMLTQQEGVSAAKDGERAEGDSSVLSLGEVRLVRENLELRRWASHLEQRIAKARQLSSPAVVEEHGSQRSLARRLQQLDVVALGLHEELRSRPPVATSVTGSPGSTCSLHVGSTSVVGSPSCFSSVSARSEILDRQIEAFRSRFLLRRGASAQLAQ